MTTETYLEITAAASGEEKKPAKVAGVAYTGGKMRLWGWDEPVVVDLAGLAIDEEVPLLVDHYNAVKARVGVVTATANNGILAISGEIVGEGDDAENIVQQARAGAAWQLSIGAAVENYIFVKEGTADINGQTIEAPFYHVKAATLREVSVVACGADKNTRLRVTAAAHLTMPPKGEKPMENTPTAAEIQAAERARVMEIKAICAGEHNDIESQAIEAGWTAEETTKKVLEAVRASRPSAPAIIVKEDTNNAKTLEAGLAMRAGVAEADLIKAYGEKTVEAANGDISLREVIEASIKLEGGTVTRFGNDTIRAAFSTVSLPGILSNVANKALLKAYQAQPIIATKLCSEADLADFKAADRYRLTDVGDLQPVAAGGEITHGSYSEEKATNQLATYAKMFSLDRQMIINDDLGAFLRIPQAMGNRAARLVDQLFFKRLKDATTLFSAANGNLLTGSASALSVEALKAAMAKFLNQVDTDDQPVYIEPKFMLVPPELKYTALELANNGTLLVAGANGKLVPTMNAIAAEGLQVIASPYLSNAKYGNDTAAWYLFGDPAVCDTFEIGYLRGKRTPTVEVADTDFSTLGKQFRVYFDIGVREIDHRGMVKAAGK